MTFLEWALLYAKSGFPVFPCEVKGKAPEGRLAPRGFKDATTDPKTIKKWWSPGVDYNIGLVPPEGMAILDVDPRHHGKMDGLPRGLMQRSGGADGGTHIFLRDVPEKLPGQLRVGVDIKRNGYVIAAPSIHPETGKRYRWPDGFDPSKIRRWPASLKVEERKSREPDGTHDPLTSSQLRRLLRKISPDGYDDWIAVGMALKTDYPDEGFDLWLKWSARSKKFESKGDCWNRWDSFRGEGRGTGTLVHLAGGKVPPTSAAEDFNFEDDEEVKKEIEKGKSETKLNLVTLGDLTEKRVDWLVPGYIAKGMLHCVAGYGGEGKSSIVAAIIAALTNGKNIIDGKRLPDGPCKVLMVTEEPLEYQTLPTMSLAGADVTKVIVIKDVGETTKGKTREVQWNLQDHIRLVREYFKDIPKCRLLVIDPIGSYMSGKKKTVDTWKDADVREVLTPWQKLAEEMHVAILFIAHFNKGKSARIAEKVMGSAAFITVTRFSYVVGMLPNGWMAEHSFAEPSEGEPDRAMISIKRNIGKNPDLLCFSFKEVEGYDSPKVELKGTIPVAYAPELKDQVMSGDTRKSETEIRMGKALEEIQKNPGLSSSEIAEALGVQLQNLSRVMEDMRGTGKVVRVKKGAVVHWYPAGHEFSDEE